MSNIQETSLSADKPRFVHRDYKNCSWKNSKIPHKKIQYDFMFYKMIVCSLAYKNVIVVYYDGELSIYSTNTLIYIYASKKDPVALLSVWSTSILHRPLVFYLAKI